MNICPSQKKKKLWASVRNDFQWKAMIAEDVFNEQVSPSLCSALRCCKNNVNIFGQQRQR